MKHVQSCRHLNQRLRADHTSPVKMDVLPARLPGDSRLLKDQDNGPQLILRQAGIPDFQGIFPQPQTHQHPAPLLCVKGRIRHHADLLPLRRRGQLVKILLVNGVLDPDHRNPLRHQLFHKMIPLAGRHQGQIDVVVILSGLGHKGHLLDLHRLPGKKVVQHLAANLPIIRRKTPQQNLFNPVLHPHNRLSLSAVCLDGISYQLHYTKKRGV